jgi:hypothetical protein
MHVTLDLGPSLDVTAITRPRPTGAGLGSMSFLPGLSTSRGFRCRLAYAFLLLHQNLQLYEKSRQRVSICFDLNLIDEPPDPSSNVFPVSRVHCNRPLKDPASEALFPTAAGRGVRVLRSDQPGLRPTLT